MTLGQYRSLIDEFDRLTEIDQFDQLKGEALREGPPSGDTEEGREWELLRMAVDAIQLLAITEKVREARMTDGRGFGEQMEEFREQKEGCRTYRFS